MNSTYYYILNHITNIFIFYHPINPNTIALGYPLREKAQVSGKVIKDFFPVTFCEQ